MLVNDHFGLYCVAAKMRFDEVDFRFPRGKILPGSALEDEAMPKLGQIGNAAMYRKMLLSKAVFVRAALEVLPNFAKGIYNLLPACVLVLRHVA